MDVTGHPFTSIWGTPMTSLTFPQRNPVMNVSCDTWDELVEGERGL